MKTKYDKPPGCADCPQTASSLGFVPFSGPASAPIALVGAHASYHDVAIGQALMGPPNGILLRQLQALRLTREQFRMGNVLGCCPPGAEIKRGPFQTATHRCQQYRDPGLAQQQVILALGSQAIRAVLDLWHLAPKYLNVDNFHGTVTQLPSGQFVVGAYHPTQILSSRRLFRVSCFDFQVALDVAAGRYDPQPITPIIDPVVPWFEQYVQTIEAQIAQDPLSVWGTVDIETPDTKGKSEADLGEDDRSYTIIRVNFAVNADEGVTVPYVGPYIPLIHRLIEALGVTLWWNNGYDLPRLLKAGAQPTTSRQHRMVLDGMWLCKHLQSDVPMGLGFWAPFYCHHGPWKHLADSAPGEYAALDGPKTWRTVTGIVRDLQEAGTWEIAHRHAVRRMEHVLRPATTIGLQVDRDALDRFEALLTAEAERLIRDMQAQMPQALLPLSPKGGLSRPPTREVHAKGTDRTVRGDLKADAENMDPLKMALYAEFATVVARQESRMVWCCQLCGAENVIKKHRCDPKQPRALTLEERTVTRWYWQEPFNPDSPDQWLAYIHARGHKPGRNKKTKREAADRETLQRLARATGDPVYQLGLDLRAVVKVRSTYAIGIRRRLDPRNRFHPQFTRRPSMFRLSSVAPNITNVIADKGERKTSLAAGFRNCIVGSAEPPAWWDELSEQEQEEYR